ncbi:hypothetical protein Pan44_19080 [Caulifigura coniformis]|uniref:Uncharacterized protein n=1 Tax=Caulifigura coniformis TaxID=2527983 RepID=A0A517SCM8_9PLAN|nr:hypothetical protein [Caulifigura coniformis]QDT53882.1 hypothetical protein Pan44_19080 [Caulifigura coniformis]
MADRRSLVEGLKQTPAVDPEIERQFVFRNKTQKPAEPKEQAPAKPARALARTPLSTRIRADLSAALKRASLERELNGIEPYFIGDILDEVLEPWLRNNGYIT